MKSVLHIKTSTGGRRGRKDRNDEEEMKEYSASAAWLSQFPQQMRRENESAAQEVSPPCSDKSLLQGHISLHCLEKEIRLSPPE